MSEHSVSLPQTFADWQQTAARVQFQTGLFIDGQYVAALAGQTFENLNPANGQVSNT